jgi:hypothetical protein
MLGDIARKLVMRINYQSTCVSFLFPHESERACHPERSARNARVAKDLLCVKQILRACGAQDDMLERAFETRARM